MTQPKRYTTTCGEVVDLDRVNDFNEYERIHQDAEVKRHGSPHIEERRGGDALCKQCGPVHRPDADSEWHPEIYMLYKSYTAAEAAKERGSKVI